MQTKKCATTDGHGWTRIISRNGLALALPQMVGLLPTGRTRFHPCLSVSIRGENIFAIAWFRLSLEPSSLVLSPTHSFSRRTPPETAMKNRSARSGGLFFADAIEGAGLRGIDHAGGRGAAGRDARGQVVPGVIKSG